jgi:hypothetical protein
VLAFRLVTYWLPIVPGAATFWSLRKSGVLSSGYVRGSRRGAGVGSRTSQEGPAGS